MAWVKEHEPEIFADAYKVMDVHGYIAWMLTGRPVSSQAAAVPVKVNECAAREPTATIFGCKDLDVAIKYARDSHRQLRHRGHRQRDGSGILRSHEKHLRDRPRHR